MINQNSESFVRDLLRLISKYCSRQLAEKIRSQLDLIRESEETALKKLPDREAGEGAAELLRRIDLDYVITECQQELKESDFLEFVLEVGDLCLSYGEFSKAREFFSTIIAVGKGRTRLAKVVGQALLKRAEIHQRQADFDLVLQDLKRVKQIFTRTKSGASIGRVENVLGIYFAERGQSKQARAHWLKALKLFEKTKQESLAGTVLMNLGILDNIAGNWEEALSNYQRALPRFEQGGQILRLAEVHHNMAMSYLSKGEFKSALSQFDESLAFSAQVHHQPLVALSYLGKASTYAKLGDHALSIAFANKSLHIFYQVNDRLSIAEVYKVKGIVQREMKHWEISEVYLKTSVRINAEYNNPVNLAEAYYELGLLYKAMGERQKTKEAFEQSMKAFKQVGAVQDARVVKAELDALHRA